jgi:hypothetical protein
MTTNLENIITYLSSGEARENQRATSHLYLEIGSVLVAIRG